ncbi:hypothetical protein DPE13_16530 [Salmonella enterica subsp. enterica]|nr:hypothetical protein [Salmonella enterica subsp. enterica serovar Adjame]
MYKQRLIRDICAVLVFLHCASDATVVTCGYGALCSTNIEGGAVTELEGLTGQRDICQVSQVALFGKACAGVVHRDFDRFWRGGHCFVYAGNAAVEFCEALVGQGGVRMVA